MLALNILKRFFKVSLSTGTGSEKDINISYKAVDSSRHQSCSISVFADIYSNGNGN
jgi:hypothetical protein